MPDISPFLTRPEKEIIEPVSRSKPRTERYASEAQDEKREKDVIAAMNVMVETEELPPPSEGKMGGRMKGRDKLPRFGHLQDSVNIWNQRISDWQIGWENRFNKRVEHTFFKQFNAIETGPYYSKGFYCAPYRNALIMIHLADTTGSPTRLLLTIWFSYNGSYWFWYMRDFYGRLEWEDVALPRWECFDVPILAPYMQIRIGVTGGSAQAYFPVFVKAIFNGV